MDKKSKPVLYNFYRSSASWRVRIALEYKQVEYEYKSVSLQKKEQYSEDYLKLNPLAQVPAFEHNGNVMTQSMAILEYLEEVYPKKSLFPKDALKRAKVREICELINAGIQPLQNASVIMKVDSSESPAKRLEWTKFWIEKGFTALEKLLSGSSGKYCVGNELTLADCFLVPQIAQAIRFKVDVGPYSNINRIIETLQELECFKKADAFEQPDCPHHVKASRRLE